MSVLDRSELEASPLADLHAIADQLGVDGFRRLRKADLINVILNDSPAEGSSDAESAAGGRSSPATPEDDEEGQSGQPAEGGPSGASTTSRSRRSGTGRTRRRGSERTETGRAERGPLASRADREERQARASAETPHRDGARREERVAEGVVELLGNGSAFLRVDPPEPSDDDVYVSAAQVRRCELVSGDRVTGPARAPRRSERYPSLVRVDTINGTPADAVTEGTPYEDLPAGWPSERLSLAGEDPTLAAIDRLTPLGRGSRAVIVGAARSGKTEALRRLAGALVEQEGMELTLVLVGVRPEEIGEWREGPIAPAVAYSFAASAETQAQAVERAVETAKRVAARGGHAVVLIDSLDGLHPPAARKALAAARRIGDGGSLTVIATAGRAFGGETTVIALDAALTGAGRLPALDLSSSGTLRAERLVGDAAAEEILQARAAALRQQ